MAPNLLSEPLNTVWRQTTIKEKLLKADYFAQEPEFAKLINAQLAGTWRPQGMRVKAEDPRMNHSAGFQFPISGYLGHKPTWRRETTPLVSSRPAMQEDLGSASRGRTPAADALSEAAAAANRIASRPLTSAQTPSAHASTSRVARAASTPALPDVDLAMADDAGFTRKPTPFVHPALRSLVKRTGTASLTNLGSAGQHMLQSGPPQRGADPKQRPWK
eukprot:TRINITY_DN14969_c0_g1_i1.p1 TRINITY_DN14969_c0_g1~~TRINITY_DN14969_c0_g1_i1.p1  ORF type:complete len:218 (-),score=39.10 TRINITY_DN14969_c0_g1_i1:345-998(-)